MTKKEKLNWKTKRAEINLTEDFPWEQAEIIFLRLDNNMIDNLLNLVSENYKNNV